MNLHGDARMTVDLGKVGYPGRQHPFSVALDASELFELFEHARLGHRVYELMLIGRLGDVWHYVWVTPRASSPRVAAMIGHWRGAHPENVDRLRFVDFDRMFCWCGDDTYPEGEAWRLRRETAQLKDFAQRLFERARAVQAELEHGDEVTKHELARVRSGTHPYDQLARRDAIVAGRAFSPPGTPRHPDSFYAKLQELLAQPDLLSVAYRGDGDYCSFRMMCNEQRRRASAAGCEPGQALRLSAGADPMIDNTAWGTELHFFLEGLGYGDLHVEEGHRTRAGSVGSLAGLMKSGWRRFGRHILSSEDQGELPGYDRSRGEGWYLYRRAPHAPLIGTGTRTADEDFQVRRASELLARADALIVAAGAGMGVDSGLPDFRGKEGFWRAYPALGRAGLAFEHVASALSFELDARRAWGFYGHRLALYRKTPPHLGFDILREWTSSMHRDGLVFTSNVDGQFQAAGFAQDTLVECHGSLHWLQCMKPCCSEVWPADGFLPEVDEDACRLLSEPPRCRHCGGLARPNVLIFNDPHWIPARRRTQGERQERWLATVRRPLIIEIGAGTAVPSVRHFSSLMTRLHGATLVRINPVNCRVDRALDVGLPMTGLEALRAIDADRWRY
jgi:NAD-dependent SIR2 family protein deacetylase